jgi:hypothetical protein
MLVLETSIPSRSGNESLPSEIDAAAGGGIPQLSVRTAFFDG